MEHKYLSVLKSIGLAARARKITYGSDMTCDAVREGRVHLVLFSTLAAPNTAKRIINCCEQNSVECYKIPIGPDELAHAVGKAKPLMSVGVTDKNLCVPVRRLLLSLPEIKTSSQTVSESEV